MENTQAAPTPFTAYQKFVVAVLAFLQFTIILDFMIISPLGAILMPALKITPAQFGVVVSIYAFSAGVSGFMAAGFADRFDRKKFLLFFYTGFLLGTLLCGMAPTFPFLMFARMITGIFGGVIGSIVLAITTDLFSFQQRGRVMGFIQTSFSASQILGIPAGLYISNMWGWHSAFLMIVGIGLLVGLVISSRLKPINAHLQHHRPDRNPFHHLLVTVRTPKYVFAFATTALLSTGGFLLMPFGSTFTVNNLGIGLEKLPIMYLVVGLTTMVSGPLVGRAADYWGKMRIFTFGTLLMIVMVTIYTNMGVTPLALVILVNSIMFIGIFSRMIPSTALMSAIPSQDQRGSFMAVSSSLQQISGGIASVVAGHIVENGPGDKLLHFDILGYVMVGTGLFTLMMMYSINRMIIKSK